MRPPTPRFLFGLGVGLVGPAVALLVTWLPPLGVTRIGSGILPTDSQVEHLRELPSDDLLTEIRSLAVGAPTFDGLEATDAVRAASGMLEGQELFDARELGGPVSVPFKADATVLGTSTWSLQLCSLAVPGLLARAYAVSGDTRFLDAAVTYILDWSKFEANLWLPKGYVFNDHATAARAIVVTEIWRLYRQSDLYQPDQALELLRYVQKLMRLLRDDRLYEYRSNHGLMQSFSLLHLAIAFPLLADAESYAQVGVDRLLAQHDYFISAEGVILENSPGYHHLFLEGLSSAWRYLGLRDVPIPEEFVRRYRKAIAFDTAMLRPDDTLPPIGDTLDQPLAPVPLAAFDDRFIVSRPLITHGRGGRPSAALTLAPVTGYAITWQGLEQWPDTGRLSQTVLHWNDFPTRVHKHADELGLSIWAGGTQWVRSIGYWPWDAARSDAIGWRSSNAPHWLGESQLTDRSVSLLSYGTVNELFAFDVIRRSPDGSWIRRQLIQPGELVWAVIDAFHDDAGGAGEIIWRFTPDVQLRQVERHRFLLQKPGQPGVLELTFAGVGNWLIEADGLGTASWNSGMKSGAAVTPSPAVRVSSDGADAVVTAAFEWLEFARASSASSLFELRWQGPETWSLTNWVEGASRSAVERTGSRLSMIGPTGETRRLAMSSAAADSAAKSMEESISSYRKAALRYGRPFRPKLVRRSKVTAVIVAAAILQVAFFLLISTRYRSWRPHATGAIIIGWLAFALFLHRSFLT